jgi:hypothetical protein
MQLIIDGGGSEITTGIKGDADVPYSGRISRVRILADQSGDLVGDLWVAAYANYPPTNANSITGGNEPTLSSADKYEDTSLAGWSRSVSKGQVMRVNVDSVATIERATISIWIDKH